VSKESESSYNENLIAEIMENLLTELIKMQKLIKEQEQELITLRNEKEHVQQLKNEFNEKLSEEYWKPAKNERGAGRKPKLTKELHSEIIRRKKSGETYRQIANAVGLSLGTVNKACNTDAT